MPLDKEMKPKRKDCCVEKLSRRKNLSKITVSFGNFSPHVLKVRSGLKLPLSLCF